VPPHWLGTGEKYHIVGARHGVPKASVSITVFISDRRRKGFISRQYRRTRLRLLLMYNCLIRLKTVVAVQILHGRTVLAKISKMRRPIFLYFTSLPTSIPLIFCIFFCDWNLIMEIVSHTRVTSAIRQSSALVWIHTDE